MMKNKGLTFTIIFEGESGNYGESLGNISALKKVTRGKGEQYSYISRQAIRYNIIEQLGEKVAEVGSNGSGDKKVIQFSKDTNIKDYPELDFFGYMKTEAGTGGKKRSAKVRLSNAISLEPYRGDIDFLTNKGLADRIGSNMNIAQSEIHKSLYKYSIVIDLDEIGIDSEDNIEIDNEEKARRVNKLLDTIKFLYRDIRGRRIDLKPLFIIGGVYDIKNMFFDTCVKVKDNKILVDSIKDVLFDEIKEDTYCSVISDFFDNTDEIKKELPYKNMNEFFNTIKEKVSTYYKEV